MPVMTHFYESSHPSIVKFCGNETRISFFKLDHLADHCKQQQQKHNMRLPTAASLQNGFAGQIITPRQALLHSEFRDGDAAKSTRR